MLEAYLCDGKKFALYFFYIIQILFFFVLLFSFFNPFLSSVGSDCVVRPAFGENEQKRMRGIESKRAQSWHTIRYVIRIEVVKEKHKQTRKQTINLDRCY